MSETATELLSVHYIGLFARLGKDNNRNPIDAGIMRMNMPTHQIRLRRNPSSWNTTTKTVITITQLIFRANKRTGSNSITAERAPSFPRIPFNAATGI
jgi:hypothetical protein